MSIVEFFEHFEGKDWATAALAVAAIIVSLLALRHNRRANHLIETAQPARFEASWHGHKDGRDVSLLRLTNKGVGIADRLEVRLAHDPSHILGLEGTVLGYVREGEFADFTLRLNWDTFKTQSADPKYNLILHWFDVWGHPRAQLIASTEVNWGDLSEVGFAEHSPATPGELSGLYDKAPWWKRRPGKSAWKLRRDPVPRIDAQGKGGI
jgi:hypothetical protein